MKISRLLENTRRKTRKMEKIVKRVFFMNMLYFFIFQLFIINKLSSFLCVYAFMLFYYTIQCVRYFLCYHVAVVSRRLVKLGNVCSFLQGYSCSYVICGEMFVLSVQLCMILMFDILLIFFSTGFLMFQDFMRVFNDDGLK